MKCFKTVSLISLFILFNYLILPSSSAGRVSNLQAAIKTHCSGTKLSKRELIKQLRKSYLACQPKHYVHINDVCKIPCLRKNLGTVIGKREK